MKKTFVYSFILAIIFVYGGDWLYRQWYEKQLQLIPSNYKFILFPKLGAGIYDRGGNKITSLNHGVFANYEDIQAGRILIRGGKKQLHTPMKQLQFSSPSGDEYIANLNRRMPLGVYSHLKVEVDKSGHLYEVYFDLYQAQAGRSTRYHYLVSENEIIRVYRATRKSAELIVFKMLIVIAICLGALIFVGSLLLIQKLDKEGPGMLSNDR